MSATFGRGSPSAIAKYWNALSISSWRFSSQRATSLVRWSFWRAVAPAVPEIADPVGIDGERVTGTPRRKRPFDSVRAGASHPARMASDREPDIETLKQLIGSARD